MRRSELEHEVAKALDERRISPSEFISLSREAKLIHESQERLRTLEEDLRSRLRRDDE